MNVWRWITDWRNGAVVLASVLVAYLGVLVVTGITDRRDATNAAIQAARSEQQAREVDTRRIDELLAEIDTLNRQGKRNGRRLATLQAQITVLEAQLRENGITPAVQSEPRPHSDAGPSPTPSPQPSSHPTSHPSPSPRPSPSPSPTRTCILIICR